MTEPNPLTSSAVPSSGPDSPYPLVVFRGEDGSEVVDCHPRDVSTLLETKGALWVDIDSTNRSQHAS